MPPGRRRDDCGDTADSQMHRLMPKYDLTKGALSEMTYNFEKVYLTYDFFQCSKFLNGRKLMKSAWWTMYASVVRVT